MDAPCDAIMSVILQSVERGCEQRGYACLLALPAPNERYLPAITALLARGVEGIVFAGTSPEIQDIDALAAQAVPWVAIGEGEDADPRRIALGRVAGGELAARYLAELGHERLAILAFDDRHGMSVRRSFAPGQITVTQARPAISDPVGVKVAIRDVLDLPRRPTAIVCGADVDALAALRECGLRGIRVPQDISIIGFGDEPFARHTVPALTSVRTSAGEIGLRAAEALRMFLAGQACELYRPSVKLVIRETIGPAA